ncbi:PREDICTED: integrator complex subunit 9 homolog isoform X2 [Tarenaya hassleriana]|uniref:integrator complex subunit 9 homolog isoform X2 n=1 Tax=Tarenaya hassleriana TaxID=28532 RepID=UPI00053C1FC2|nr:PREDICTED: integrator complex subunit 9 homolog isoform X2 [Tarenaya hassleriana]
MKARLLFKSMKLTCLRKGDGFQCPPCHMLNLYGFSILIDCPLDLSAITIFSPIPHDACSHAADEVSECPNMSLEAENSAQKRQRAIDKQPSHSDLVCAEPWYKTVNALHLLDVSFIDIVLISSPMGMLGLPFLTQNPGFSAKIYVTEATAKIGQLMMEDLVLMHMEFRQFYGPQDCSFPWWITQLEHEEAPPLLNNIAFGEDGNDLGCWMPLYSFDDIKDCVKKIQTVKFAEEACYNGTLIIKALSSGLDIGTSNWLINEPKGSISYVSGSIFLSQHTMDFDYHGLKGSDVILYSDFSCLDSTDGNDNCSVDPTSNGVSALSDENKDDLADSLSNHEENLEEMEKLAFISSCAADSANAGGSTLITISRIGTVLQLLELIANSLGSFSQKVPIYVISSVAEELLAYMNTVPEWLCQQRQDNFISGEPLFGHTKFIKDRKILLFPAIYSPDLIMSWQEPCIIFAPHWSLRLGPSVQILRRWCGDPKALLVLEDGIAASLALLPFRPMAMKVLQCSFLSGIKLQKLPTLLKILQPKIVLLSDTISQRISLPEAKPYAVLDYSENKTLHLPKNTDNGEEVEMTMDLASNLKWKKTKGEENLNIARLEGEVVMDNGKHRLLVGSERDPSTQARPTKHWGSIDPEMLLESLTKMGIDGSIEREMGENGSEGKGRVISITSPENAVVEVAETGGGTVVTTDDEDLASRILIAIDGVLDGI